MSISLSDAASAAVSYTPLRAEGTRVSYIGPNHSDMVKDMVVLNTTPPKRSGASFGNRRASINVIASVTVPTPDGETETKDMKFELVTSVPVGTSQSDLDEIMARAASAISDANLVNDVVVIGRTQQV